MAGTFEEEEHDEEHEAAATTASKVLLEREHGVVDETTVELDLQQNLEV